MTCTAPQHASNGVPPAAKACRRDQRERETERGDSVGRQGRRATIDTNPLFFTNLLHDAHRFSRRAISLSSTRRFLARLIGRRPDLAGEIRERGSLGSWSANGRRAFLRGRLPECQKWPCVIVALMRVTCNRPSTDWRLHISRSASPCAAHPGVALGLIRCIDWLRNGGRARWALLFLTFFLPGCEIVGCVSRGCATE
jgi:hypothetical protein